MEESGIGSASRMQDALEVCKSFGAIVGSYLANTQIFFATPGRGIGRKLRFSLKS